MHTLACPGLATFSHPQLPIKAHVVGQKARSRFHCATRAQSDKQEQSPPPLIDNSDSPSMRVTGELGVARRTLNDVMHAAKQDTPRRRHPLGLDSGGELQILPNRRFFLATLGSLSIVLVSNLGGSTGFLLGLDGGRLAAKLKIDSIFPVRGVKRCINYQQKFEFQYPGEWLADRQMYVRRAQRTERTNSLDPAAPSRQRRVIAEPEAAYGPPGSSGEENISVVVAPIQPGFKLEDLGSAEEAGRRFLETNVASINANREAKLIHAQSRREEGHLYYNLEYTVKSPQFFRHNISVYTVRDGLLYTFNAQCPEEKWQKEVERLAAAAKSFQLFA